MLLLYFFVIIFFFGALINGSFELIILAIFLLGAFFTWILIDTSLIQTKRRKKLQKNCNPIKDIYLKSDDEILEKLQKLSRPFYSILDELKT